MTSFWLILLGTVIAVMVIGWWWMRLHPDVDETEEQAAADLDIQAAKHREVALPPPGPALQLQSELSPRDNLATRVALARIVVPLAAIPRGRRTREQRRLLAALRYTIRSLLAQASRNDQESIR
jgi:hypothetical protein